MPANLISGVIEDEIVVWRKRLSEDGLDAGTKTISWHLSQRGITPPALSTIHRVLRRRGFVTLPPPKAPPIEPATLGSTFKRGKPYHPQT